MCCWVRLYFLLDWSLIVMMFGLKVLSCSSRLFSVVGLKVVGMVCR